MNKVCLIGRLTNKTTFGYTNGNVAYARFTLAVNRNFKNSQGERQADFINFINCMAYRKTAELINQYTDKGDLLGVEGRIQTGSYTAQDGSKRYTTDVVIDTIEFLQTKGTKKEQETVENEQMDVFADFGENVEIDDNFLE